MVSITDPFKAIAGLFTPKSKGKEIITVLQHVAQGDFGYRIKIPKGDESSEHVQILKGLQLTLRELRKFERKEKSRRIQLVTANKKLRELDRNKREFMELASHQLKTPLASLQLGLEVLERNNGNWHEQQLRVFDEVKHSYDHLAQLVQSLLEAVRIDERVSMKPKCHLTSAHQVMTIIEKQFRSAFENKGLEFIVEKPSEAVSFRTDPEFVVEILQNILENALKYTVIGTVRFEATDLKRYVQFYIADTGIGIPQLEQSRTFEKMFRASNVKNSSDVGSGLGLYYTRQLIKRIKGKITFTSEEGRGSMFCIRIPKECSFD